ncbi:MAG: GerW family sporulation protein [Clostridia bacterium]|nr:GerW family sporulation protein [Clostridia bacterium]
MNEHPIENLMKTAMNSIKDMVDVNTIVGDPIETTNNMVIIPVSKVCFGFAAGGTEFESEYEPKKLENNKLPFGGGSGAAVHITPVGFIIIDSNNIGAPKFIPVEHSDAVDKLLDYVPDLMEKANKIIDKILKNKEENTSTITIEHKEKTEKEPQQETTTETNIEIIEE